MAVTIIDKPFPLEINTISNGFDFTVTSDLLAQDNFRFTFRILIDGVQVGIKKVPSTGTNTTVNLQESVQFFIEQSKKLQDGTTDIWDIDDIEVNNVNPSVVVCEVFIGDQYELNQVIIASELPDEDYVITRGKGSGFDFAFASRFRSEAVSTQQNILLRVVRDIPMFSAYQAGTFDTAIDMTLDYEVFDALGGTISSGQILKSFNPITSAKEFIVYFPVGTDHGMFAIPSNAYRVTYTVFSGAGETIFVDTRIIDPCLDGSVTLMWRNDHFQWSQFTFDAQNSNRLTKKKQQWESQIDGMRDVNVVGRNNPNLNTSMLNDAESVEIHDLFLSEEVYIIPSGERVVIEQSSIEQKTQQRDQAYQYNFRIQKSARIFRA